MFAKLKNEMIKDLDQMAKKEYSKLIRAIKTLDDAKNVCNRMGMSKQDAESYIQARL